MMHNTGIKSGSAEIATGALSVEGPQPVWMTLNEARDRAFTGEVVFEVDPEVLAYFDKGVVYYAERVSDASLGRRLLDAGVVDAAQLERGTVRVGDVEHLGRMFDRDATVDRDAVLVVTETSTEDLIADLANREIATVRVTAYRHHPSGVHRWFVAPIEPSSPARPVGDVAQIGASMVEDLPDLTMPVDGADDLTIEWDDPFDRLQADGDFSPSFDQFVLDLAATSDLDADDADAIEMSIEMAEFVDTDELHAAQPHDEPVAELHDDSVADLGEFVAIEPMFDDAATEDIVDEFEFAVVWPDGSEEVATDIATDIAVDVAVDQHVETPADEELLIIEEPTETPDDLPAPTLGNGEVRFEIPSLALADAAPETDVEVSDDVADAVRRAIAAIESASIENPVLAAPVEQEPTANWSAFAPPTMDMRAEVLYGLEEAEATHAEATEIETAVAETISTDSVEIETEPDPATAQIAQSGPTSGIASVVFVDDDESDTAGRGGDERSSALRRLIGSLRRKDR